MADIIDDAQAVNELHQELSLRKFREGHLVAPVDFDGINCVACSEPVEPARVKLGFWLCLRCAIRAELRRRQGLPA